jgi:iron(II)-dependent oxidoreductase
VVGVTWYEALAYCRWLGEKLLALSKQQLASPGLEEGESAFWRGLAEGRLRVGLPSEVEWEKAARGAEGEGRVYPWGDGFDAEKANVAATGLGASSAVGCFPGGASPYGLQDMSGNVWEWTRSLWGEGYSKPDFKYPYDVEDGREKLDAGRGILRILRGGGWSSDSAAARCAYRDWLNPYSRNRSYGFRVGACGAFPGS